jgi:hypothetical protein
MTLLAQATRRRRGQRGGSRFNLIVVLLIIGLAAYCAHNFAPVAYNAYLYKDFMQETVNKAAYPPVKNNEWVKEQLRAAAGEYQLPDDAGISVQNESGRITARVTFRRPVQLPGYVYEYNFDHTARSSGFIK